MTQETKTKAAHARITAANQRNSPLLRLPAELRNRVYEYALGGHEIWVTTPIPETKTKIYLDRWGDVPAFTLLKVCSQIYAEAALLPYSLNTFFFNGKLSLDLFVKEFPKSATQAIRRLMLDDWAGMGSFRTFAWNVVPFQGLQEIGFERPAISELLGYCSEGEEAKLSNELTELQAEMPSPKVFVRQKLHGEWGKA
ncbi:unnamed protein product [Alternaria sp. RS040]